MFVSSRECVVGLGEVVMREASLILQQHEPEEAEVCVVCVMYWPFFTLGVLIMS